MILHLIFVPIMVLGAVAAITAVTTWITTLSVAVAERRRMGSAEQAMRRLRRQAGFRPGIVQDGQIRRPVVELVPKHVVVQRQNPAEPDDAAKAAAAEQQHRDQRRFGW